MIIKLEVAESLSEISHVLPIENVEDCHRQQYSQTLQLYISCCELLSKVYIFATDNSLQALAVVEKQVVNCFQKFISLPPTTV